MPRQRKQRSALDNVEIGLDMLSRPIRVMLNSIQHPVMLSRPTAVMLILNLIQDDSASRHRP